MKTYNVIKYLTISIIGCLFSCQHKSNSFVKINLSKYEAIRLDSNNSVLYVTLLHAYKLSGGKNSRETYASLLVCRESDKQDSLYVFDLKKGSADDLFDEKSLNQGFILNVDAQTPHRLKEVTVEVPQNFKVPKNIRYTFGSVNELID